MDQAWERGRASNSNCRGPFIASVNIWSLNGANIERVYMPKYYSMLLLIYQPKCKKYKVVWRGKLPLAKLKASF